MDRDRDLTMISTVVCASTAVDGAIVLTGPQQKISGMVILLIVSLVVLLATVVPCQKL
jgi:hypothetical protein